MIGTALVILIIYGSIAGIELPGLIKKKQWREFTVYTLFFALGLGITVMYQVFNFNFAVITDWFLMVFS